MMAVRGGSMTMFLIGWLLHGSISGAIMGGETLKMKTFLVEKSDTMWVILKFSYRTKILTVLV